MNRRGVFRLAFASSILVAAMTPGRSSPQTAKSEAVPASNFGSVAGQVLFAGNSLPVRFAEVALQPLDVKSSAAAAGGKGSTPSFQVYQTDLSGAFLIDHVSPGVYYVVVKYPGSLSPFAAFSQSQLESPTPEQAKQIAAVVPTVSVTPSNTATINVRLDQGASLSGTVRFDDGAAFAHAGLSIDKRGADGKWATPRATASYANADLGGHWQIGGLPPGEYRVKVLLSLGERHVSSLLSDNVSSWNNTNFTVPVYLGDTEREADAKTNTLTDNQALAGLDITVPIAKMHTINGAVIDARNGQALNGGTVALVDADAGTEITSAKIDWHTRSYSLPFVFEGTYKLAVKDAHEARVESLPFEEGSFGTPRTKETLLREYAPGEMPLVVTGEMSGVNLPVTVKAARAQ